MLEIVSKEGLEITDPERRESSLERARAAGRPVFVDFTADWCITCKVNESVVLEDSRVQSELARLRFVTFKADWTLYDDEIRQVLASFGRAGGPMYLVYAPNSPGRPKLLPELLTVDLVIDALRDAAGASGTRAALCRERVPPTLNGFAKS